MVDISRAPIALDLVTTYLRATVGAQPRPLGKGKIVGIIVQNTFFNIDGPPITANNVTVMIGDESAQVHEVLPGVVTPIFYTNDLENIYARVQSGTTPVAISLLVYKERN